MILESVKHGLLIWPTIEENGVTRIKKYVELSASEKIQADCDMKVINIILQGLPTDIYSLVNHHRVAKDHWEKVQLLMQATSLTKQKGEYKLYDAFDKFALIKGESLHQYYLRFTQLMNDMNIYKMKLEEFQFNTKFLNSLPPEWSKFVTDVNLVKDLHTTNFDQLHAYLEQHELHANEVCLMCERRNGKVLNEEELELLADPVIVEGPVTQSVIAHNVAYQADYLDAYDSDYDKISIAKAVLMANLSSYGPDVLFEVPYSENTNTDMLNQSVQEMSYSEPSYFVEHPENEIHSVSNIISYSQYLIESQNAAVQDTNSSAQQDALILSVFEQLSNQVTNCSKANKDNLIANESLSTELERYKERVKLLEERQNVDLSTCEKLIIDDIIREKNAQFMNFEKEINNLKQTLSEQSKKKELLTKTFNVFKNESKEKEAKNIDTEIALKKKVKELDNIVYKMGQSAQTVHMLTKPQDGNVIAKETNVISIADFEETLMLEEESRSKMLLNQTLHPITDQSVSSPVKIEASKKLPKIMPNALTEGEWGVEHTKVVFQTEIISFLKTLKDIFNVFDKDLLNEVTEVQTVFTGWKLLFNMNSSVVMNDYVNYVEMCNKCRELEAELIKQHNMVEKDEYNRLSKRFSELEQHCISLEIAIQLKKNNTYVNQTEPSFNQLFDLNNFKAELQEKDTTIKKLKENIKLLNKTSTTNSVKKDIDEIEAINIELEHRAKEHAESLVKQLNQKSVEITDLNAQLQEKVFVITTLKNDLRKFKGKDIVDNAAQVSNATIIALGMYKLDPVTLAPKDKNNRETHIYYLKHTMEQVAILREIVEQAYSINPSDSASYSAYKYVKLIQELLGYVRDTCHVIHKPRVNPSTSASGSKPLGNTTNDKIPNSDSKNVCNEHVKHPVKSAKALCSVCNECLFDANHAMCLIDHVNSMNVRVKSASKKNKKKEEWKPTKLDISGNPQEGLSL
ncbi:hypothetical protein Tco_0084462 [Tanacetum coccineum]